MILFQGIWILISIAMPVFSVNQPWSFSSFHESFLTRGKYTFFLSNDKSTDNSNISLSTVQEIVLATLQFIINLTNGIRVAWNICVIGVCSMTLWTASKNFVEKFTNIKNFSVKIASEKFEELRNVASCINSVWSVICLWIIIDMTTWLSIDLDASFRAGNNWMTKIDYCYILAFVGASLVLSAESNRTVR